MMIKVYARLAGSDTTARKAFEIPDADLPADPAELHQLIEDRSRDVVLDMLEWGVSFDGDGEESSES